ncbi:MAG: radical SAM protein [Myxococcales bacterium]|nr:radical SAM protein [Myxococcales bacterium]
MRRVDNPKNRFESAHLHFDEEGLQAPWAGLRVHEERCKEIVSENRSPDVPFRYSVNPYRGCQHACSYCYARPSHQYWGYGAGSDFERELIVKVNAPERLRARLERPGWKGETLAFSGNTDCYQPLEGRFGLTRQLLAVCLDYRNPVAIITKSPLITRDLELLVELSRRARLRVFISIAFADDRLRAAIEPGAPSVERRFEALSALSEAGIETGVAVAPLIVGLGDDQAAAVLERAAAAGARHCFRIALRLPAEVAEVFETRLREALPARAEAVLNAQREIRGGGLNQAGFGQRMQGSGPRWRAVEDLFDLSARRFGLRVSAMEGAEPEQTTSFRRPRGQLSLFDNG